MTKCVDIVEYCNSLGLDSCLKGDEEFLEKEIYGVESIDGVGNGLTFCKFSGKKGEIMVRNALERAAFPIIILPSNEREFVNQYYGRNVIFILSDHPRLDFARVYNKFFKNHEFETMIESPIPEGIKKYIGDPVKIGKNVVLSDLVVMGNNVVINDNVVIHGKVVLGNNVIIGSGTVIGNDGFGYERIGDQVIKFPHVGGVNIHDNVEIGSNVSIDRGSLSNTVIGEGTKIDNLVHIAHNARIGKNCFIIALSMVAGSVIIEDNAWIAPSSAIRDGLIIGKNSLVGLGAVVVKDIPKYEIWVGNPAKKLKDNL